MEFKSGDLLFLKEVLVGSKKIQGCDQRREYGKDESAKRSKF